MFGLLRTCVCSDSLLISRIWPIDGFFAADPKNGFLPDAR